MDRTKKITVLILTVIALLVVGIPFYYKGKIENKNTEINKLKHDKIELLKRIINDSLNNSVTKETQEIRTIIIYKTNERKKDSIVFISSDTVDRERIFSKHTKNY